MINGVEVVTLCGSTRFTREMMLKEWELTKQGKVVMGWCVLPTNHEADGVEIDHHLAEKEGVHEILDEMHKRKIDLSDRIHVLNIGGYIGDGTRDEIRYAKRNNKGITYEEVTVIKREKITCPVCKKRVAISASGYIYGHKSAIDKLNGAWCSASNQWFERYKEG